MKTYFLAAIFLLLSLGCSQHNAFSDFQLSKEQSKSEDSILSAKIISKGKVDGVISALYLNNIYPQRFQDGEYFYVVLYTKEEREFTFYLNKKKALYAEVLLTNNRFSHLINTESVWKKYFLLHFAKQKSKQLNLWAESAQSRSTKMLFRKED